MLTINKKKPFFALLFFLIVGISDGFYPARTYADSRVDNRVDNPVDSSATGIILADDQGKILYGKNKKKPFIPASTLKILTSLAAIKTLGPDYRFATRYYFDADSKNIYIKGFGDPLFISEVIEQFCHDIILKTKIKQVHHVILDRTYFADPIHIPGKSMSLNPYDAPVGALCANFNTIMFKWDAAKNRFVSAEPQTPLLSIFHEDIKKTRLKKGRIILTKEQSLLYPGLLIRHFLEKNSIRVTGSVQMGTLNKNQEETKTFLSPFKVKDIVQKLLKYSNNFMANQLLLTLGAKTQTAPATLEKGVKAVLLYSKENLKLDDLTIVEGSGLSRSNLISPDQMIKILIHFLPYHSLLTQKGNDFFKTGTLLGVRTRAGYILGKDNKLYPYAIMVNQKGQGYDAIRKDLLDRVSQISSK